MVLRHGRAGGFILNPLHRILLAFPIALYPLALVFDITYLNTVVIQWSNFAVWLIVIADVFTGLVLAWALIGFFTGRRYGRNLLYLILVAVMFVCGVINAMKHSQDAWFSVQTLGLVLSIICTILALIAGYIAYSGRTGREATI